MSNPLSWIRYLLVIVPAFSTMYLDNAPSYTQYILIILLMLWFVQLRKNWFPPAFYWIGLTLETAFIASICFKFAGHLPVMFLATLFSLFDNEKARARMRIPGMTMLAGAMNITLYHTESSLDLWSLVNLFFVIIAVLLHYTEHTLNHNQSIEQLNDQLRFKHYELNEARTRAIQYSKEIQSIAKSAERNRISHEIHDDLGHKLIRLKMMLEAIVAILPEQQDKGLKMLVQVKEQLSESMDTLRTTVRKLKPEQQVINSYSLNRLIHEFAESSGVIVDYRTSGTASAIYPSEKFILYRNAQEAMTNAVRHGQASEITILLHYGEREIIMSVSNNGSLPPDSYRKGLGIQGMEERVELLNGELSIKLSKPFTIVTRLPHVRIDRTTSRQE